MQFGKDNFYLELQKSEVYTICLYKDAPHNTRTESFGQKSSDWKFAVKVVEGNSAIVYSALNHPVCGDHWNVRPGCQVLPNKICYANQLENWLSTRYK